MNKYLGIVLSVFALLISGFLSYNYFANSVSLKSSLANYKVPAGSTNSADASGPKTEECPINGEMLTKSQRDGWEKRRPMGVMIENHKAARPQSGISSADVVYEAVAEGGITRFLNIFYCKDNAKFVGPVRSARVYFITLVSEYGSYPLYVHVGGANCNENTKSGCGNGAKADALGTIKDLGWYGYNDMNLTFSVGFPYVWRDPERLQNVDYEHTAYSSTQKLWEYAAKNQLTNVDKDGQPWDKNFTKWKFKEDSPATTPTASKISFTFWKSMPDFNVDWTYDKARNSYLRTTGGQAHLDKNTNKQLEAKNVIVAFAKESFADDGYDLGQHMLYKVTGSNDAIIFMDGKAIKGTWEKKKDTSRMKFLDTAGKEIPLNRGQDFIEVVPEGNTVDYK